MQTQHLPVMAALVVEFMVNRADGTYIDCTVGPGGHARHVLDAAPSGRLLGLDLDPAALAAARENLAAFGDRVRLARGSFAELVSICEREGFDGCDGVLFDLGYSSVQLDDPGRGLSYSTDGPIDMRLDPEGPETAADVIARAGENGLAEIIREFGEERRAHPIARAILEARDRGRLETTADLARAVLETHPRHRTKTLARVFQALRIAVNRELENLRSGLEQAVEVLRPRGRIAVVSYHSLEDRIVKRFFADRQDPCICPKELPHCVCGRVPTLRVVTKRVVRPDDAEIAANPRSRSAKMRVAEKLREGETP